MRPGCLGPSHARTRAKLSLGNICDVHVPEVHPQVIILIQEHGLLPGLTQPCGLIPGRTGQIRGQKGLRWQRTAWQTSPWFRLPVCVLFDVEKIIGHGLECEFM